MTVHNLANIKAHGHLSSHNLFIELMRTSKCNYKMRIRLADLENFDYMDYASTFFNYRCASVWSAPEVLDKHKKVPKEMTPAMDVYSYGLLLWELWHCQVPFENNLEMAIHFVKDGHRPKLVRTEKEMQRLSEGNAIDVEEESKSDSDDESGSKNEAQKVKLETFEDSDKIEEDVARATDKMTFCDKTIADVIRKCWSQDPRQRPNFFDICSKLSTKIQHLSADMQDKCTIVAQ